MCHGQLYPVNPDQGLSQYSMLIRNAAYLNREGATLLATGDLNNAIPCLFDSLEHLFRAGGLDASLAVGDSYASRSFPFEKQLPRSAHQAQMHHQTQIQQLTACCEDGSFFVYSCPFVFQPITVDVPEYATNCAAVVLFNLGLALHQRGRLADSRALYRAQTLYDMSLALVGEMPFQAPCANLKVAATNNKAHIQLEVSEAEHAKTTLRSLLAILSAAKTSPPPFGEVEIEKFYMNILHLNGSILAGAA